MDGNVRKVMRAIGWTKRKLFTAHGRHELDDNGERLLIPPNKLALLDAYYALHLLVVYRTRFSVLTEERPGTAWQHTGTAGG